MKAVEQTRGVLDVSDACTALGLPRATWYRAQARLLLKTPGSSEQTKPRKASPRALTSVERGSVLELVHEPRFCDLAVPQVYTQALDEGNYICSQRTMYRILSTCGEVRERRDQRQQPTYAKPELLATGPNQVWSWDITKLKGPRKWNYFHLYVILDIFSRNVVGWMIAYRESAALAQRLIAETIAKENVAPGQLTIHADRGSSMKSKDVALLLADLGVTKTHSRPHVSNDNPYSEAQFKTLKYRPEFPDRFGSIEDARSFCSRFFAWYCNEHRHSGIAMMTPASVHHGRAQQVREQRALVLEAAWKRHPERFARQPQPQALPSAAWINPPTTTAIAL